MATVSGNPIWTTVTNDDTTTSFGSPLLRKLLYPGMVEREAYKKRVDLNRDIAQQQMTIDSDSLYRMMQNASYKGGGKTSLKNGLITDKNKSVNTPIPAKTGNGDDVTVHGGGELVVDAPRTSIMEHLISTGDMNSLGKFVKETVNYYKVRDGVEGVNSAKDGGKLSDYANDANIKKYLAFIKEIEGGGVGVKNPSSTAKGTYQFLDSTVQDLKNRYNIDVTKPENENLGALALMKDKGALDDIVAGRFDAADKKLNTIWPSLPGGTQMNKNLPEAVLKRGEKAISPAEAYRQSLPEGKRKEHLATFEHNIAPVSPYKIERTPDLVQKAALNSDFTAMGTYTQPAAEPHAEVNASSLIDKESSLYKKFGKTTVLPSTTTPSQVTPSGQVTKPLTREEEILSMTGTEPGKKKTEVKPTDFSSIYKSIEKAKAGTDIANITTAGIKGLGLLSNLSKQFSEPPKRKSPYYIPRFTDFETTDQNMTDAITREASAAKRTAIETGQTHLLPAIDANVQEAIKRKNETIFGAKESQRGQRYEAFGNYMNTANDVDYQNALTRYQAASQFNAAKNAAISGNVDSIMGTLSLIPGNKQQYSENLMAVKGLENIDKLLAQQSLYTSGQIPASDIVTPDMKVDEKSTYSIASEWLKNYL